jgi:hypothetical protein
LLLGSGFVNMFPQQQTPHATIDELLDTSFPMQSV